MGILGAVTSMIGGNEAADEQADALRMARKKAEGLYDEQAGHIGGYLDIGEAAQSPYTQLLTSPGELDPVASELNRRSMNDTYNMLRARGQGGSGFGWNTLFDTAFRNRQNARQLRFSELLQGLGIGQNAIGQLGQAGRDLMSVYLPAQQGIGAAKAAGTANMFTQLGSLGDQALSAAMGGMGGGMSPGVAGNTATFNSLMSGADMPRTSYR